jgi:hypothetical protein
MQHFNPLSMRHGFFLFLKIMNSVIIIIKLRVTSRDPMVPFRVFRLLGYLGYQVIGKREDRILIIMEER